MNQSENRFYLDPLPEGKARLTVEVPFEACAMFQHLITYGLWGRTIEEVAGQLIIDQLKKLSPVVFTKSFAAGTFHVAPRLSCDDD